MPQISLPHASIRYDLSGEGDPTAFVHGSLVNRRTWDSVLPALSQSLTTLAYDRRGHGESEGPTRRQPVRDDAGDLADLLTALDLYPVHLIAHSYGVAVALRLAVDRPELVRSLVLHEPMFFAVLEDDPATAPEAERLWTSTRAILDLARAGRQKEAAASIVDSLSEEEGTWSRFAPEVQKTFARHVDRWVEELSDPEATRPDRSGLAELLIPVLLTTGERSPPFLHRITSGTAALLRNATVRTLPGVGHAPHRTDPDLFVATIHGFLVERNVPFT